MKKIQELARVLETVLGCRLDKLARELGAVRRQRKFSGQLLVRMLVLTLLKDPHATYEDWALTAAQLGTPVSPTAVQKRFTEPLAKLMQAACQAALSEVLTADPVAVQLMEQFTAVFVGDSSSIALPADMAAEFPGCGGSHGSGQAALKIQVRWDLKTGALPLVLIESGKASDCKSLIAQQEPLRGSLELFDLGYFEVARFRRLNQTGAFWLSRLLRNTHLFNEQGEVFSLRHHLARQTRQGVVDLPIQLGEKDRLPCRLIAIRVPEEMANRRRQQAREKARDKGRELTPEYSELLGWTIFVTNLPPEKCDWKTSVVLYRSRWQIELLFKLWKSHNLLATHRREVPTAEVMAVFWAKLMGVIVQHWLLVVSCWHDPRRSLRKAAQALRDWIVPLLTALHHRQVLQATLAKLIAHLRHAVKIQSRHKCPSHFQLLQDPSILNWNS